MDIVQAAGWETQKAALERTVTVVVEDILRDTAKLPCGYTREQPAEGTARPAVLDQVKAVAREPSPSEMESGQDGNTQEQ